MNYWIDSYGNLAVCGPPRVFFSEVAMNALGVVDNRAFYQMQQRLTEIKQYEKECNRKLSNADTIKRYGYKKFDRGSNN